MIGSPYRFIAYDVTSVFGFHLNRLSRGRNSTLVNSLLKSARWRAIDLGVRLKLVIFDVLKTNGTWAKCMVGICVFFQWGCLVCRTTLIVTAL